MALESENWLKTIFRFLGLGRYRAEPPALADNDAGELQLDSRGNLRVRVVAEGPEAGGAGASQWNNALGTYESKRTLKSTGGTLYFLMGFNAGAAPRYIQVFDGADEPVPNTVPAFSFPVEASAPFSLALPRGRLFERGIFVAASTDGAKYAPDPVATFFFVAEVT